MEQFSDMKKPDQLIIVILTLAYFQMTLLNAISQWEWLAIISPRCSWNPSGRNTIHTLFNRVLLMSVILQCNLKVMDFHGEQDVWISYFKKHCVVENLVDTLTYN